MNTAAKVAKHKEAHPEMYCPHKRCLWRTGDGSHCPRHTADPAEPVFYKEEVAELVEKARTTEPTNEMIADMISALKVGYFEPVPDEPESEEEKKTWQLGRGGNPAYTEGWDAGFKLDRDVYPPNPYPAQTANHRAWREGFRHGRDNWDMDGGDYG